MQKVYRRIPHLSLKLCPLFSLLISCHWDHRHSVMWAYNWGVVLKSPFFFFFNSPYPISCQVLWFLFRLCFLNQYLLSIPTSICPFIICCQDFCESLLTCFTASRFPYFQSTIHTKTTLIFLQYHSQHITSLLLAG